MMYRSTIAEFADSVMRAVVSQGAANQGNVEATVRITRDEIKAFFLDDRYADARGCLFQHSLPESVIIASVATEITRRITAG